MWPLNRICVKKAFFNSIRPSVSLSFLSSVWTVSFQGVQLYQSLWIALWNVLGSTFRDLEVVVVTLLCLRPACCGKITSSLHIAVSSAYLPANTKTQFSLDCIDLEPDVGSPALMKSGTSIQYWYERTILGSFLLAGGGVVTCSKGLERFLRNYFL